MINIQIIGGLGNQMFQYAYARALHAKGYDVSIDLSAFETYTLHGGYGLDKYRITLKASREKKCRLDFLDRFLIYFHLHPSVFKEKGLKFNPNYLSLPDNKCVIGYFQNEKYFQPIRPILLNEFTLDFELSEYTKKIDQRIQNHDGVTISLHIRRGDYVTQKANSIYAECSIEYYLNAIQYFEKMYSNIIFLIFSDDIVWVQNNLPLKEAIYIFSEEKRAPHEDIFLMSHCDHNIVANSTFSWWGAWLNQSDDKIIIAPSKWFNDIKMEQEISDIFPPKWIRI